MNADAMYIHSRESGTGRRRHTESADCGFLPDPRQPVLRLRRFELGGLLAGIRPVWASEIEPFPIRVTTKRLPS